eukprot:CAMPEP_0181123612 /NCGR_PEP_ID=MMETSP1071-20121207/26003_1 /TAXON_ID=35127 /ORGANISM="Thalassiosira sp., Strain NH16" /LENGTH=166 /DNA_ID=CAMNT_0023208787 /DNA_START=90 /DNA_END=590 /DNA_ORIENTATION=+
MAFLQRVASRCCVHAVQPSQPSAFVRCGKPSRQRPGQLLLQTRTKRSSARTDKKAAISRAITSNQNANHSVLLTEHEAMTKGIFGMRPVDYSVAPPLRCTPPPPPPKPGVQKYLWIVTLIFGTATFGYFYVNNKNDNFEYWRAMQSGEALQMDDGDEDDYDDDEDE